MLPGVNRALTGYEGAPQDRDPAGYRTRVSLPSFAARQGAEAAPSKFMPTFAIRPNSRRSKTSRISHSCRSPSSRRWSRLEKISSTDLTKMYLERLKRYRPKLLCVITLTEDHALEQAAEADKEIARRKISRTAARNSVRRKRPVQHEEHPDHLGGRTVQRSGPDVQRDVHRSPV